MSHPRSPPPGRSRDGYRYRRSRSHVYPERRSRRRGRAHSYSPVRRRSPHRSPRCQHRRGRSPTRSEYRSFRVSRVTSTLASCSSIQNYPSRFSQHRRRDPEESSVTRLIVDRREGEEDATRDNRTRIMGMNESYIEDLDDGDLKEDTIQGRVCRAAKVVSGFLISMGLVLVFYVIITTIIGESTPLDIFNFEYEMDLINHQNENISKSTNYPNIKEGIRNLEIDFRDIELSSTDGKDIGKDSSEPFLRRSDDISSDNDYENEDNNNNDEHNVLDSNGDISNATDHEDAKGRSYIAYIPVPLNNEDEEEEEEEEAEEEENDQNNSNRRSSQSNPFFVPVMIMPGGNGMVNPNRGLNPNQVPLPNMRPGNRPIFTPRYPSLPYSPPQVPRQPLSLPPNRNSPAVSHPLLPQVNPNNGNQMPPSLLASFNNQHPMKGGFSYNNPPFQGYEDNVNNFNHGNPIHRNPMKVLNTANPIDRNNNIGFKNNPPTRFSGNRNVPTISSAMPNIKGRDITSNSQPNTGISNAGNEIWNSLFEIMNQRRSGAIPPMTNSEIPERMKIENPRILSSRVRKDRLPPIAENRRLRPRLLPKSRMSGPLPNIRGQFPRYRLPPIPPPPGMPIVPRRPQPPPPGRHNVRPPRDFQYPKDSASIQDIIRFMKEREKNQQSNDIKYTHDSQDHMNGHSSNGPNSEYDIGDQNHIIGPNPFGDINFQHSSDQNFGNNGHSVNSNDFGGGGIPGFNNGGGNNFNSGESYNNGGNNYNGGNNFKHNNNNYGENSNSFNSGSNNFNSGGNNFNSGGNNFNNHNSGSNDFNSGGNNGFTYQNQGGGNTMTGQSTRNQNSGKIRPFNIMLDVYPMEASSGGSSGGSRPFQTSISYDNNNGGNNRNNYQNNGYSNNNGNDNNRNNNGYNDNNNGNNWYDNTFGNTNNGGRFSKEDDADKHEIILHLNLFSKTPSSLRNNGRNDGSEFSGRNGAVSLEIPLTGQMSPLDVYRALMARARSNRPQAQVQSRPGSEGGHDEGDEVEIELFDVEEGPRLLDAIEQGLRELNKDLPPEKRFIIDGGPTSVIELYEAVNGDDMVTSSDDSLLDDFLSHHNPNYKPASPNNSSQENNHDTDYYLYYDYYDYHDEDDEILNNTTDLTTIKPTGSEKVPFEELPTPCWNHKEDSNHKHIQ